jgi:putative tricarboxylic transport membrane protein
MSAGPREGSVNRIRIPIMHDTNERSAASTRTVELALAGLFFAFGLIVIYDCVRLGFGWAEYGPESGYWPFYIGVIICLSSFGVFVTALMNKALATKSFVSVPAFKLVLKVLIPTIVYAVLVGLPDGLFGIETEAAYLFGIYTAAFIFIAFFMWYVGGYGPVRILPIALGVPVVFFVLFEVWFRIPLPKGFVEAIFGLL